jgi:4-hydroxybenzoate polyprenyltransferase
VQGGQFTAGYVALGAAYWILLSLGIEVTNRLADRREDAINRPERTALCGIVGWSRLKSIQYVIWCTVFVLDLVWILVAGNLLLVGLLASSFGLGVVYSRGPRLSRKRFFSFITLNLLFGGAFLLGWSIGDPLGPPGHSGWDQFMTFLPLLVTVGLFILALIGIKDITDSLGDTQIGYRSLFVDLVERRSSLMLGLVAGVPFFALLVFVSVDLLPMRMLILVTFVPVSAIVVSAARSAHTKLETMLVREAFYGYWLIYSSSALLLLLPHTALAGAIVAAVAYWMLTTRWLHWGRPLSRADLLRIVQIAIRRRDDFPIYV